MSLPDGVLRYVAVASILVREAGAWCVAEERRLDAKRFKYPYLFGHTFTQERAEELATDMNEAAGLKCGVSIVRDAKGNLV